MTEAARRRTQARIRLIKIQWLLILALIVALIISFVRVLLRTGHHERKSERICGMADFSPQGVHSSLTQKPISRKYGGKKLMKSKLRNEIKSYIVRQGMTMQEVVDLLRDEHGWSDSVSNLSNKLQRESLRYVEAVQLADALGYEIVWQRRK